MSADTRVGVIYQTQMQLVTSLSSRSMKSVMRFEMAAAAARVGVDIRELAFLVQNPEEGAFARRQFEKWHLLLSGAESGGGGGKEGSASAAGGQPARPGQSDHMIRRPDGSYKVRVRGGGLGSAFGRQ